MNLDNFKVTMPKDESSLYVKLARRFHDFHFKYPGRREVNVHESHLNERVLVCLRIVAFIYLTGIYVWALSTDTPSFAINIIYLTMVGYLASWLYFGIAVQHQLFMSSKQTPHLHKILELIFQIALCSQLPITLVFWTLLWPIVLDMPNVTTEVLVIQGNLHSVPLLFLALDTIFNSYSFHIRHITVLIGFTIIYLVINMTYSLAVKPIYKPLPWNNLQSYILGLACVLATLSVHFLVRYIYRNHKAERLAKKDQQRISLLTNNERVSISQERMQRSQSQNSTFRKSVQL